MAGCAQIQTGRQLVDTRTTGLDEHTVSLWLFDELQYPHMTLTEKSAILNAPGGIRTPNLRFRRPMLYPIELQAPVFLCVRSITTCGSSCQVPKHSKRA
jgi:hypothetical protein